MFMLLLTLLLFPFRGIYFCHEKSIENATLLFLTPHSIMPPPFCDP